MVKGAACVFCALLLVFSFSCVFAQPGQMEEKPCPGMMGGENKKGPNIEEKLEELSKELSLTVEQKAKVKEIMTVSLDEVKQIMEESREKVKAAMEKSNQQIEALLTEEQKTKFKEMKEKRRARHEGQECKGKEE